MRRLFSWSMMILTRGSCCADTCSAVDGFEFIARVRAESRWRPIPIIVVTAKTLTTEDLARLNGQVQHLVHKGEYSGKTVLAALDELVPRHARRASPDRP